MMVQALHELEMARQSLPMSLDQSRENAVILEDALGRRFPIHLETIRTWKVGRLLSAKNWSDGKQVFHCVLTDLFSDGRGLDFVIYGRYVLQDAATGSDLSLSVPLKHVARPGQLIVMSVVFCNRSGNEKSFNSCPSCRRPIRSKSDEDVQW